MPTSQDVVQQAQPKRPAVLQRHHSASSYIPQTPSEGHSSPRQRPPFHKAQRHVVGHTRMGSRNPSIGKNLHKLNKVAQAQAQAQGADGKPEGRHHRRALSGSSTPSTLAAATQRPNMKRNASTLGVVRHPPSTGLKRNHSSGQLPRQASTKNILKHNKSEVAPAKRSLAHQHRSRPSSPDPHHAVHFDVGTGEDDDDNDGWTEESASQSPVTTRSNTRQNSVILESQQSAQQTDENKQPATAWPNNTQTTTNPPPLIPSKPDETQAAAQINGASSYHPTQRMPDADAITSRLLQRSASQNAPPQMSSVSVVTNLQSTTQPRTVATQSQASTLADHSGKDLVSRFMDGDGSGGTPREGAFFEHHRAQSPPDQPGGDLEVSKRNKSAPNMAEQGEDEAEESRSHSRSRSLRSGTTTPNDIQTSRTLQKLWLQRQSSVIEPQKLIPAILPRTGGPQLLGVNYAASSASSAAGNRLDPRLQRQFDQVALEYRCVRRFRNPLGEAVVRLDGKPGSPRRGRIAKLPARAGGGVAGVPTPTVVGSAPQATPGSAVLKKARVNFQVGVGDELEGRQSYESSASGELADGKDKLVRTAAAAARGELPEEICRRLWDSPEVF